MKRYIPITIRFLVGLGGFLATIGMFWSISTLHRDVNNKEGFTFRSKIKSIVKSKNEIEIWLDENPNPFYIIENTMEQLNDSLKISGTNQTIMGKALEDDWLTPSNKGYTIISLKISNIDIFNIYDFNQGQKETRTFYIFLDLF